MHGLLSDYVRAYAWLNVAAARGKSEAEDFREVFAEVMTRKQIGEEQVLSREIDGRTPRQVLGLGPRQ